MRFCLTRIIYFISNYLFSKEFILILTLVNEVTFILTYTHLNLFTKLFNQKYFKFATFNDNGLISIILILLKYLMFHTKAK